jgi:hypothetical protein
MREEKKLWPHFPLSNGKQILYILHHRISRRSHLLIAKRKNKKNEIVLRGLTMVE